MSALGQKRTNHIRPKSDFVRYCPKADIGRPATWLRSRAKDNAHDTDCAFPSRSHLAISTTRMKKQAAREAACIDVSQTVSLLGRRA